jgi:hypothetical protein
LIAHGKVVNCRLESALMIFGDFQKFVDNIHRFMV